MSTNETSNVSTTAAVKFRENSVCAVQRTAEQISVFVRGVAQPIVLRFAQLSDAVRAEAMGYGMEVRLTRAAAIERDSKSGRSATPQEKAEAIRKLAEHYASGTESWTMSGGGGGGLNSDTTALIQALAMALELSEEKAEEAVRSMSSAERSALRVDSEIKPFLDEIYAERAKAQKTDTSALLAALRSATRSL